MPSELLTGFDATEGKELQAFAFFIDPQVWFVRVVDVFGLPGAHDFRVAPVLFFEVEDVDAFEAPGDVPFVGDDVLPFADGLFREKPGAVDGGGSHLDCFWHEVWGSYDASGSHEFVTLHKAIA